jgi:membrane protein
MLAYFESTLTWTELIKRTYKEMMADDALGIAAQLAYYFFLALFPAILCVIALASFLPLHSFTDEMVSSLGSFAPAEMLTLLREQMTRLSEGNDGGILSIGLIGALWSSSAAMVALIGAMNRAYDIEEARPWWKVRLLAILLTASLAVFIVASFGLILGGSQIGEALGARLGMGEVFLWIWTVLQWPLAFALVVTGIGLIYYFAASLWLLGSLAFRFYVVNFGNYEATYGAIAGVMMLMLWFYLSGLVLIIGAEASAEIEHASPWGKAPAEKVPGQKRKLGAAAGVDYRQRNERDAYKRPDSGPVAPQHALVPITARPSFLERAAAVALVVYRWRSRARS